MLDPETGYVNPEELAYVIIEPIQGEGGYRFPSETFGEEVAALQRQHDITLVADEIQSGLGRTGEWWGSDHYAYEPDIIASAKGLRVGATIAGGEVFPEERSRLSSTWGAGDLIASAQGVATIDAISEGDLLDHASRLGQVALELLHDADIPRVTDVRGEGLMLALDWESKQHRDDVLDAAMQSGLLTLGCGHKTLRLLPPLDVRERELRMAVNLLTEAAEQVV